MFNFKNVRPAYSFSAEWLLGKIGDELIFTYYFGEFKLHKIYPSKLRRDKKPSTGFYVNKNGKIIYNDYATGEQLNCFQYVQKLYNLSFREALDRIASDFGLLDNKSIVPDVVYKKAEEVDKTVKAQSLIQIEQDRWLKKHLKYWKQYEITEEELLKENDIFPVKKLWLNKREIYNPNNELRFAYHLKWEDGEGLKIYSPKSEKMKWLSSIPNSEPFGVDKLPYKSDTVIITKSWKDRKVLLKLFTDVIAVQNESEQSFPLVLQERLLKQYKKAIVIFDSDSPGVNACKKFNDKGFGYFNTPKEDYLKYGIKDPSDYVQTFGLEALKELLIKKEIL